MVTYLVVLEELGHGLLGIARGGLHPAVDAEANELLEGGLFLGGDGHVLVQAMTLLVEAHAGDVQVVERQAVLVQLEGVDGVGEGPPSWPS